MLCDALEEPATVDGPVHLLLPPALKVPPPPSRATARRRALSCADTHGLPQPGVKGLAYLADAAENRRPYSAGHIRPAVRRRSAGRRRDQPPAPSAADRQGSLSRCRGSTSHGRLIGGRAAVVVHVPADGTAARILAEAVRRIPVADVLPGMLLAGLDGRTPFDRLRPLLPEARGPVTRLLLAAWDQALVTALRHTGGPTALARALGGGPARISVSAVAAWADEDRIGPRHAANVTRVGEAGRTSCGGRARARDRGFYAPPARASPGHRPPGGITRRP